MNQTTKKKKHRMRRELTIGIPILVILSPLIGIAIIWSLLGIASGILLLLYSNIVPTNVSLTMAVTYGAFLIVFTWLLRHTSQRLNMLLTQRQNLKVEQERVAHLFDTTSAEARLKFSEVLSDDGLQIEQESPTQNSIRDQGLTL